MSLYQKGLLAFAVVVLIAVVTVAVLVGQQTVTGFRQYAMLQSNRVKNLAASLEGYFEAQGSWAGIQEVFPDLLASVGGFGGSGRGQGGGRPGEEQFQLADAEGVILASTGGMGSGRLSTAEMARAQPLTVEGVIVGYLIPEPGRFTDEPLGESEEQFLTQVRSALFLGGAAAFIAALLIGGLLMRGIVSPVRDLTRAAHEIAAGDLQVQAPVRGRDEVAELGTAFNTMAESLARAERARRLQTADIAHELRNPLAVLQGTLEALADGVYAPSHENLQPALDQVHTLNRLVDDLRLLALADAGELRLERQPVDVSALLRRVGEAYRVRLEEKDLTFVCDVPAALPTLSVDSDRLAQVVGNILDNATKYVPSGGRVHLSAEAEDDGVVVSVADNGSGLSPEGYTRLFERFWRGEPSRSRATGGSGLGLSIARKVIEAHGGRIWAEPTPGGGLTVAFRLISGVSKD